MGHGHSFPYCLFQPNVDVYVTDMWLSLIYSMELDRKPPRVGLLLRPVRFYVGEPILPWANKGS